MASWREIRLVRNTKNGTMDIVKYYSSRLRVINQSSLDFFHIKPTMEKIPRSLSINPRFIDKHCWVKICQAEAIDDVSISGLHWAEKSK